MNKIGIPPFTSVFEWTRDYSLKIYLNFSNYITLFQDDFYISTFISSVLIAGISAGLCLIIGFMMAYGIFRSSSRYKTINIFLLLLPFWTSFLIRVYAWMGLLSANGAINITLLGFGIINEPILLLDNPYAVCVGIIYCYLPFMVLPIYASLQKIDAALFEASFDLGATPWRTFWRITVPLAMPGIIAGFSLVFIPALGEFVIPELLGGPDTLMIGRTLWSEFFNNRDWPQASALAVTMIIMVIFPMMIIQAKKDKT